MSFDRYLAHPDVNKRHHINVLAPDGIPKKNEEYRETLVGGAQLF